MIRRGRRPAGGIHTCGGEVELWGRNMGGGGGNGGCFVWRWR